MLPWGLLPGSHCLGKCLQPQQSRGTETELLQLWLGGGGAGSRYHPRMTAELGSILNITDFAGLKDLKVRDLGRRTVI